MRKNITENMESFQSHSKMILVIIIKIITITTATIILIITQIITSTTLEIMVEIMIILGIMSTIIKDFTTTVLIHQIATDPYRHY